MAPDRTARTHRIVIPVVLSLAMVALTACSSSPASSKATGSPGAATTQPGSPGTTSPSTGTPGTGSTAGGAGAFGGDPCKALTATDIASVTIGGLGSPTLTSTKLLGGDDCQYGISFKSGGDFAIPVLLVDEQAFNELGKVPPLPVDTLTGIGMRAVGVDEVGTYTVVVQTAHGYFSVSAIGKPAAVALATAAAARA